MSIEEVWRSAGEDDKDLASLIQPGLLRLSSKDPLVKLRRNLLAGAIMGILIACGYIAVLVKFPVWQVFVCIGIVFLFTVWASVKSLVLYRQLSRSIPENSLLQELKNHYQKVKQWMALQQQVGLFIYPVSAAGGFMIGGSVGAGKSINEIMQKPVILIALVITLLILVPLCFYLAKWMSKKAFGKYAEQLKQHIDLLTYGQ